MALFCCISRGLVGKIQAYYAIKDFYKKLIVKCSIPLFSRS